MKNKGNILINLYGFTEESMFNPKNKYTIMDCYVYLKERLGQLGYSLKSADENGLDNCKAIIFINLRSAFPNKSWSWQERVWKWRQIFQDPARLRKKRDLFQECLSNGLKDKIALFLWEAGAVSPENYNLKLHRKFPKIFTWNDDYVDNRKYFKFYLPYYRFRDKAKLIPFNDKKLLVNMNKNKISNSSGELFSQRLAAVEYFNDHLPLDFDFYGRGWENSQKYVSFRGHAMDKLGTLSKYKFCLCYENFQGVKGYITEKIFDCFRAYTVPIYWGASDIEKYIDPRAYIDRRQFKSNEELAKFLLKINEIKYQQYLLSGQKFLKSPKFRLFMPENFANTIIRVLSL